MLHEAVAIHDQFGAHPVAWWEGFGTAVDAMGAVELAFIHHMRARAAHIAGGSWPAVGKTSQELHFDRYGPVLFLWHLPRVLAMKHNAAIEDGIGRRVFFPFVGKTILELQVIPRKRLFIIQMAKLVVECAILIIAHPDHIVFNPKRIAEVDARLVVMDLDDPVVYIFTVEERLPTIVGGGAALLAAASYDESYYY